MPSSEHDEIQNWFLERSNWIQKEKTIENHRADIVLRNKVVVEIQCTPLSIEDYEDRNLKFKQAGFYPVWVFGKEFYEHARKNRRYGQYIRLIEQLELEKHGYILYHNKYNLFFGTFSYKWASGPYDDYCEIKGWYKIEGALDYSEFLKLVEDRMIKFGFINWKAGAI